MKKTTTTSNGAGQPEERKSVPYALVRPDPNQPRKTFTEASLNELADSIREQGILQPLIVEHVPARYKIGEPNLHSKEFHVRELVDGVWQHVFQSKDRKMCEHFCAGEENLIEHYRIVAGERRWRAAGTLSNYANGTLPLPVIVRRNLTPQQRFAIQFIENNQREAVTAIEEAEAMKAQIEGRRKVDPKFSPEMLAKELGQSRATVYERLKLTRLHKPVREALLSGKINSSVAGLVAIIPLPNQQEKLLKEITNEQHWSFPFSFREVQEIIEEQYCKALKSAPFDQELPPKMEEVRDAKGDSLQPFSCKVCPNRTGNLLEQFPELKDRPNVCTRPDCFAVKCKLHWLAKAENAREKGKAVMLPAEFRKVSKDYLEAEKETRYNVFQNEYGSPMEVLGKHAPEAVLVATADGLKKFFKRAEVNEAAAKAKVKLTGAAEEKAASPEEKAKLEAKQAEKRLVGERRQTFVKGLGPTLMIALKKLSDAKSWETVILCNENGGGSYDRDFQTLFKRDKNPRIQYLGHLFSENIPVNYNNDWDDDILKIWKFAGLDLLEMFAAEEKKAQKALPLAMAEPKQNRLIEVKLNKVKTISPSARMKIAANARKRWAKVKATVKSKTKKKGAKK